MKLLKFWTIFLLLISVAAEANTHIVVLKSPLVHREAVPANRFERYKLVRKIIDERQAQALVPFVRGLGSLKNTATFLPIINAVALTLTEQEAATLARHPEVRKIIPNRQIYIDMPRPQIVQPQRGNPSLNDALVLHQVDKLIAEGVDIHRPGKIVGIIDTGIDGSHPEFQGKISAFKTFPQGSTQPADFGSHGTHVAGIIAAGSKSGVQIGVYPGAKLAVAGHPMQVSNIALAVHAFQWMLDPDGNPNTPDHAFVINNSWGWLKSHNVDPEPFFEVFKTLRDADILVLFAAGNEGSSGMRQPSQFPTTFTSAAVDKDGVIASFSSWGPHIFQGKPVNKPEVASMGVKVHSTLPKGQYGAMSGTSMASPFTAGAVALLGSQFPELSPYVIADALVQTAQQPGHGPWDRKYGYGLLNVYGAYQKLKTRFRPVAPFRH